VTYVQVTYRLLFCVQIMFYAIITVSTSINFVKVYKILIIYRHHQNQKSMANINNDLTKMVLLCLSKVFVMNKASQTKLEAVNRICMANST